MTAKTDGAPVLSALLYPLGFIYIILGGYQLYTENTLPPVALAIERLASLPAMLRQWTVVLFGNFAGGLFGALVLAKTGVFSPEAALAATELSTKGLEAGWWDLFFKASFAGLIVAGVVWLDFTARDTVTRFFLVYIAFLTIPLADLFHVVVSFTELMYLVFLGEPVLRSGLVGFVLPVLLGNTIGGVLLVTVVNYFQTTEERLDTARFEGTKRRLTLQEWTFGGLVGRSYVPLLDTAEQVDPNAYHILVPIANPRTETHLVELACMLASTKEYASVHIVHVVQISDRMSRRFGSRQTEQIVSESADLLQGLQQQTSAYDIGCNFSTVVSHRSFSEIFDTAARTHADLVLMGWGADRPWAKGRSQRPLDELTGDLPCDFVVLKDRGLDASRILVPTAGGPDSALSGEIARLLHSTAGSDITLLHVVDSPEDRETGERFLRTWADEHGLEDAELLVDDSGDVEEAIAREVDDKTLLIIGATEKGLLSRLVADSLHLNVVNEVDCSVLLAERPSGRSLFRRLFGRG